tara:strand:- start:620 stop:1279 length:660 start_codon:yes stop_codon:yes gene_type:complete
MNTNRIMAGITFLKSLAGILFLLFLFANQAQAQVPETNSKARVVISPYAQAVPNNSYTFISVSHPSLDSALTQIGVGLEVVGMSTVVNTASGRATIFTIDAGETHRIFVANNSHSTLTSSFVDSRTHIIFTQDTAQFGSIRAVGINEDPATATTVKGINKFDNLSQLDFWGVVYVESSGTGFPMEFLGDAHDSTIGRNFHTSVLGGASGKSAGIARGVN